MNPVHSSRDTEMRNLQGRSDEEQPMSPRNIQAPENRIPQKLKNIRTESSRIYLEAKPRFDLVEIKRTSDWCSPTGIPFVKEIKTNFSAYFGICFS